MCERGRTHVQLIRNSHFVKTSAERKLISYLISESPLAAGPLLILKAAVIHQGITNACYRPGVMVDECMIVVSHSPAVRRLRGLNYFNLQVKLTNRSEICIKTI